MYYHDFMKPIQLPNPDNLDLLELETIFKATADQYREGHGSHHVSLPNNGHLKWESLYKNEPGFR